MSGATIPTMNGAAGAQPDAADPAELMACPRCDLLHRARMPATGERAQCRRCGARLIAPRDGAFGQVVALGVTSAILMVGAVFFPFLSVSAAGLDHRSSIFDAAMSFSQGLMLPLALAVLAFIVLIPVLRAALLIYTLVPLARGRPPLPGAARVFHLAEALRPWSMAEIFIVSTAVALVKIAGMATIGLGTAFWAFCALVIVVVLKDTFTCKWTIWRALNTAASRA